MAIGTASQQAVKGLDLGTSQIVLATLNGQKVDFNPQLNAFVDIPYSKMTEQMLTRENILHQVEGAHIYAFGNRADEFAKFLNGDTRRSMQSGLLNPAEPKNLQMIELLLDAALRQGRPRRRSYASAYRAHRLTTTLTSFSTSARFRASSRSSVIRCSRSMKGWRWSIPSSRTPISPASA